MKKAIKITALLVAVSLLATLCCSCSGGQKYKDDISVTYIASIVDSKLSNLDKLDEADENYITVQQKIPLDNCDEHIVKIQTSGIGIDEYGIFRMKSTDYTADMKTTIEAYLELSRATFNENYAPNERPKIEAAEVRIYGNYVIYAVLSDTEKAAAFSELERAIK